ncbi:MULTISPECIES: KTSC domain-containing protein [unclassified Janthinobacterium]|uniref:KTSC domain-containing protein n=1 Tax=unclassified Janthinobacterium TaxID=2610881 RepID=UPI0017D65C1A|nr:MULTISPECIES: KTSC domain-containing protein [unclassified Janthinobacterium]MBB5610377.1 hypothetical protein [Janthinobacterium sp. S3T4]MBB5615786.1 hypothetical protein [Janthinobacterium sp. S3M3]
MSTIPQIIMHQVESSQFAAIGHAPELDLLAVQFHPKKSTGVSDIYHYQNFSAELFAEFLGAESQGSFFIQRIKKCADQFPYSKVDQAAFSYAAAPPASKPASLAEAAPVRSLSKELLAGLLTGREYGKEMLKEEEMQAKAAGLIVIFGASDDLMEFRGLVDDERGAPTIALIDDKGLLPFREDIEHDDEALKEYFARAQQVRAVDALWAKEDGYSWTYRTDVPHATFEIVEDGEPYCRGIVIDVADLGGAA